MRRLTLVLVLCACSSSKAPSTPPPPAAGPLAEGAEAPDFTAPAHDGSTIHLADLRGQTVVLYFYPKDDTPGCTAEAKGFQEELPNLATAGAKVIGVSLDGLESHKAFADKYDLTFPLVVDTDGKIAKLYGVDTSRGVAHRTTFVIGKDGKIAKTFGDVKVSGHDQEVLAAVKSTQTAN